MRPFQLLLPSQFWSTPETAGPTVWDVLRFWDQPRPLRPKGRSRPPPFGPWEAPTRVEAADVPAITQFWTDHYNGADWVFRPEPEWIAALLSTSNTFALIVRNGGAVVGSIVCRGISDGPFRLGSLTLPNAYMIEGLCIHPDWRGQHLAGWLIAWVDHLANATAPQAFFWSREAPPRDPTYVASHTYAYLPLSGVASRRLEETGLTVVPWDTFRRIWASYVPRWDGSGEAAEAAFPTQLPMDPLLVWRKADVYAVVSDTRRWTRDGRKIWEVQFCGDLYAPWEAKEGARDVLESIGAVLVSKENGLLFVTSAPWQGGCTNWPGWVVGTAGHHTTYIYNYMPPVFHRLATLFLRNEL